MSVLQDFRDGGYEIKMLFGVIAPDGCDANMPSFRSVMNFSWNSNEQSESIEFAEFHFGEIGPIHYFVVQSFFILVVQFLSKKIEEMTLVVFVLCIRRYPVFS